MLKLHIIFFSIDNADLLTNICYYLRISIVGKIVFFLWCLNLELNFISKYYHWHWISRLIHY